MDVLHAGQGRQRLHSRVLVRGSIELHFVVRVLVDRVVRGRQIGTLTAVLQWSRMGAAGARWVAR